MWKPIMKLLGQAEDIVQMEQDHETNMYTQEENPKTKKSKLYGAITRGTCTLKKKI